MVAQQADVPTLGDDAVDQLFRALADATRRDILRRTLAEEATVSQLAGVYAMSFAAVQKHVAVLAEAGLVSKRAVGRERRVSGNPDAVRRVGEVLDRYERIWRDRIRRLDVLLVEDGENPEIFENAEDAGARPASTT